MHSQTMHDLLLVNVSPNLSESGSWPERLSDNRSGEDPSHSGLSAHIHDEDSLRRIVNRLSRLEGHIRGVKTMVQEHRPCPDVLIQVAAVRGGLDKVARMILDEHLSECITRAVDAGNIEEEVEALKKALDRFIA